MCCVVALAVWWMRWISQCWSWMKLWGSFSLMCEFRVKLRKSRGSSKRSGENHKHKPANCQINYRHFCPRQNKCVFWFIMSLRETTSHVFSQWTATILTLFYYEFLCTCVIHFFIKSIFFFILKLPWFFLSL